MALSRYAPSCCRIVLIGDDRCRCNAVLSAAAWADVGRWLFADKTLVTSAAEGETAKVGVRSKVVMVLETAYWRTRQQFIVELVKEMRLMAGDAEGALIDTEAARSVVRLVNPERSPAQVTSLLEVGFGSAAYRKDARTGKTVLRLDDSTRVTVTELEKNVRKSAKTRRIPERTRDGSNRKRSDTLPLGLADDARASAPAQMQHRPQGESDGRHGRQRKSSGMVTVMKEQEELNKLLDQELSGIGGLPEVAEEDQEELTKVLLELQ